MANTYYLLNSNTVGAAGAASITFASIPNTYTDLLLVMSPKSDRNAATDVAMLSINSNTSNGSWRELWGNVAAGGTDSQSGTAEMRIGYCGTSSGSDTNIFSSNSVYIPDYAGSYYKSFSTDAVTERNSTDAYQAILAGLWADSSAISSLTITPLLGTLWAQYSTFYLYGVSNA